MKRAVGQRAVVLVAVVVAVMRLIPLSDPDYHWHLATGRYILAHRTIPAVDPFSHTALGQPWLFVDWVSDVAMYLLQRALGDAAVVIAFAAIGGIAIGLAADRARRRVERASAPMVFAIALAVASVVSFRVTPRPQTAILLLTALLVMAIDRARRTPRILPVLPLIIALWQNVHSSAVLGVVIVAAYVLEANVAKRAVRAWSLAGAASIGALFVAVRPVDRLLSGFAHLGDARVAALFPEWGSPFAEGVVGGWVLAAIVLVLLAGIAAAARAGSLGEWLSVLALSVVGFGSARFLPLVAIVVAPLALEGLCVMGERLRPSIVAGVTIALAAFCYAGRVTVPSLAVSKTAFPERAANFVRDQGLTGNLFNDFHFGGYLIWRLEGRTPVFVDGRSMAVYGIEFVRDAALATDEPLNALVDRYGATIAIVPPDRRMGMLQRRPGWALVMFDDAGAVLVREDAVPRAAPFAYRALTPGSWFDFESLRADPLRLALAQREIVRAHADAPDSSQVAVLEVVIALSAGDLDRAGALVADAEARFPDVQRVARAKMITCVERGDQACACATARRIAHDYPFNSYASSVAITMNCP